MVRNGDGVSGLRWRVKIRKQGNSIIFHDWSGITQKVLISS